MGFDTSMYSQIKPLELPNPLAQALQVAQYQHAQGQNDLAKLVMGEKQREIADTTRMNDIYSGAVNPDGTIDRTKLVSGLAGGGLGSKLPGLQKTFTEQDKASADLKKTNAEIDAKNFDLAKNRFDTYKRVLGGLAQVPNLSKDMVIQYGNELVQQGILPVTMYQNAIANLPDDPAQLRERLMQGVRMQLTPEQMFTVFAPKPTQIDNGQQIGFRDTNPNSPTYGQATGGAPVQKQQSLESIASNATTRRGQDMTDARARETLQAGKAPAGYRFKAGTNDLEPIPGGPAEKDKALTETQGKATGFAARMQDASKIIDQLGPVNPSAVAAVGGVTPDWLPGGAMLDAATNYSVGKMHPKAQQYQQAQENWVTANLRLESGAAIGKEEKQNEVKKWFPQPGDGPERIAQKAAARKVAEEAMMVQAGPGAKQVPGILQRSGAPAQAGAAPGGRPSLNDIFGNPAGSR